MHIMVIMPQFCGQLRHSGEPGGETRMRTAVSSHEHERAQSSGAPEAIKRGCTCDPVENCNGEGHRGQSGIRLFAPDDACPLHGLNAAFGFTAAATIVPSSRAS